MENTTPTSCESLIIDEGTIEYDIVQRLRNGGATPVQPQSNDPRTAEQRERDLDNANDNRPAPPTDQEIINANPELVALLKNRLFIKENTRGKYRSYLSFYDNVPKSIVQAVNKIGVRRADGREHTRETISRVVTAMKITRRFRPLSFYAAIIATALTVGFATLKLNELYQMPTPAGGFFAASASYPDTETAPDVETLLREAGAAAGVPVYPYRVGKVKQEIKLSGDNSLKNIRLIIAANINELLVINNKKH